MKFSLGLCLVICIFDVYCEDVSDIASKGKELYQYVIDCAAENKVDMKTLADIGKNKVIPNTPEMRCYFACVMKKSGLMNADGTFTKRYLEDKDTEKCRNISGKDACEIAFGSMECGLKNAGPTGFHISA